LEKFTLRFSKNKNAEVVKNRIKKKIISLRNMFPLSNKNITWDLKKKKKLDGIKSLSVLKLNKISNKISPKKKKKHQKKNNR
jgi:hypothetical protein